MGLMKISTYHKMLSDEVHFVKGIDHSVSNQVWDRIYVTSLFTFYFDITINTINYYKTLIDDLDNFYVGGIMASLMTERIMEATGLQQRNILVGLFTDTSVVHDDNDINIDTLPLDYDLLEEIEYKYPAGDNYFSYTTRGCPNKCSFCAVPILEPTFSVTNNIVEQIRQIDERYGPKQNLLMLDNNILNAPNLKQVVDSLCEAGFFRDAKYVPPGDFNIVMNRYRRGDRFSFLDKKMHGYLTSLKKRIKNEEQREQFISLLIEAEEAPDYAEYMLLHESDFRPIVEKYRSKSFRARYIDFNQGVDARRINDETMLQLSRLAIRPLRIAFDDVNLRDTYVSAVETAYRYKIKEISNYVLFNYHDKPEDLYTRLEINIQLNRRLGINIFSFPMRYAPITMTDRSFVGKEWTLKELRAISAILQVTKGIVAAGSDFFYTAFGKNLEEYREILAMPRDFIIYRSDFKKSGEAERWRSEYAKLSDEERKELLKIVSIPISELRSLNYPDKYSKIIPYYYIRHQSTNKAINDDEDQLMLFDNN